MLQELQLRHSESTTKSIGCESYSKHMSKSNPHFHLITDIRGDKLRNSTISFFFPKRNMQFEFSSTQKKPIKHEI